ncbi:MAG: hypothetical protein F6K04_17125 [Leptolyngbya sp. SIO4C5]|nr:hypothetical protein [Leptolyngbya sp. SIO4C5]
MFQVPLDPDAQASTNSYDSGFRPDHIRHVICGSLPAAKSIIYIHHKQSYAKPNDLSDLMPTNRPNEWFSIVTKQVTVD